MYHKYAYFKTEKCQPQPSRGKRKNRVSGEASVGPSTEV